MLFRSASQSSASSSRPNCRRAVWSRGTRPCRAAASQSSASSSRPNCRRAVWSRGTRPPSGGSSMAEARSAAQPSSPPKSQLGQQWKRLSKRACKRAAQPAGPVLAGTPAWGSGELHVQRMPEPRRRDLRPSSLPSLCGACRWRQNDQFARRHSTMQNVLFLMSPHTYFVRCPPKGLDSLGAAQRESA